MTNTLIHSIIGREVLDSRGTPTVEAEVRLMDGRVGRGISPSGASTGKYEALELRDNDKGRFMGKGVLRSIEIINTIISPALAGKDCRNLYEIDKLMISLDGTKEKRNWVLIQS